MTMALIQFCCCWNSLRSGCYASALYTMIYFTVTITMVTIFGVAEGDPEVAEFGDDDMATTSTSHVAEDPHTVWILNICVVSLSSLGLISTFVLLYGLANDRRQFLVPWIVIVTCTTAVDFIYAVYLLIHVESLNPISAIVFTSDFVLVIVNVYCILCVISQFQELKKDHHSAQGIVGLAVTEDLFDINQPPLEEIKLSEVVGPDQIRCQQLDAVCGDVLWIDCHQHRDNQQQHGSSRPPPTSSDIRLEVEDDDIVAANSPRRVTFKCRPTVGS